MKLARITNDNKLLLADELIEKTHEMEVNEKIPNLSLDNTGGLTTLNEIIEYPPELEGGRNLLEGTWDLSWEKDSHRSYQYLLRPQIQSITKKVEIGDILTFSFDVDVEQATSIRVYDSNGHPGISYGSQSLNVRQGKQRVSFTKTLTTGSRNTTIWYLDIYNNNNGVKFSVSNIKIEKGTQATSWTPAPEDLGLEYSDDIQYFNMGIKDNRLMVTELIEGGV